MVTDVFKNSSREEKKEKKDGSDRLFYLIALLNEQQRQIEDLEENRKDIEKRNQELAELREKQHYSLRTLYGIENTEDDPARVERIAKELEEIESSWSVAIFGEEEKKRQIEACLRRNGVWDSYVAKIGQDESETEPDMVPELDEGGNQVIDPQTGQVKTRPQYRNSGGLLDMIAKHESGGDYNITYGGKRYNLTTMAISEVRELQRDLASRLGSSASGKYQIMGYTLDSLIKDAKTKGLRTIDENGNVTTIKWGDPRFNDSTKFDEATQDMLGKALLVRRDYDKFLAGKITNEEFIKKLSMEWASLPKDASGKSYYAGDAIGNRAFYSYEKTLDAVIAAKEKGPNGLVSAKTTTAFSNAASNAPTYTSNITADNTPSTPNQFQFRAATNGNLANQPIISLAPTNDSLLGSTFRTAGTTINTSFGGGFGSNNVGFNFLG